MFSIHHVLFQIERCCSTNHCIFLKAHSKKLAVPCQESWYEASITFRRVPLDTSTNQEWFCEFQSRQQILVWDYLTKICLYQNISNIWNSTCIGNLITSMYGRSTYIWLISIVDVGKYTIHWWYENCPILTFIVSFRFAHHGSPPLAILSL